MNKLFIACIALLALTATARPHAKIEDTRTVLAEMEKDPFGSSMLSAVQMNLAAKNPLDEINLVLQKILKEVEDTIEAADKLNKTRQDECDSEITTLRKSVVDLTKQIENIQTAIKENTLTLENAKKSLAQAKDDLTETLNQIQEGAARRKQEHESWAARDYQKAMDIATLEEGIKLIQHMVHGVAFSQIKTRYDKVLEQLSKSGEKHTLYKPLIVALTELATKLNYENVMAILQLLNNIKQDTIDLRHKELTDEENSQAKWSALLTTLVAQKNALKNKIAQLEAQITAVTAELEALRKSLEATTINLENTQSTLAAKIKQCDEWAAAYAKLSYSEGRKRDILNKLIQHMEERSSALEGYMKERNSNAV